MHMVAVGKQSAIPKEVSLGIQNCEGNKKVREWIGGVKPVLTMRFGNGVVSKLKSCKPSLFEPTMTRS
jgi:hypothetical protein